MAARTDAAAHGSCFWCVVLCFLFYLLAVTSAKSCNSYQDLLDVRFRHKVTVTDVFHCTLNITVDLARPPESQWIVIGSDRWRRERKQKISNITAIRSQEALLSDPKEINAEFCSYYASLYSSEVSLEKDKCYSFLNNLELPSLTQEEANYLSRPITLTELYKGIKGMKKGKSPSWDRTPLEFYVTF